MPYNCVCITLAQKYPIAVLFVKKACVCVPMYVPVPWKPGDPFPGATLAGVIDDIIGRVGLRQGPSETPWPVPWKTGSLTELVGYAFDSVARLEIEHVESGPWSRDIARVAHLLNEVEGFETIELQGALRDVLIAQGRRLVEANLEGATLEA